MSIESPKRQKRVKSPRTPRQGTRSSIGKESESEIEILMPVTAGEPQNNETLSLMQRVRGYPSITPPSN